MCWGTICWRNCSEMNLPNAITLFRILLIPVFMAFLLGTIPYGAAFAVGTFVLAAATDSLDGYFARRRRQVTTLGAFLDPLADKLLVSSALLALVQLGKLSAWVAMVIITREFAVSGLRMVAAAEKVVIAASMMGKVKTAAQMVAVVFMIIDPGWSLWGIKPSTVLMGVAVILTLWSGIDYFVRAWDKLRMSPESSPQGSGKEMKTRE